MNQSSRDQVDRVLVVSKTHLDVGFTATAAQVRARYLDDFFPRAIEVAEQLRRDGRPERFRWTTGSWILSEALEASRGADRRALESAVERGDLCWHALPFTLHTEFCDRSLLEHGLTLSAELDRRFGRRTRAAKVTDVPGHTRALVSVLADAGVEFLHVGLNPASAAPEVPNQFVWTDRVRTDGVWTDGVWTDGAVEPERSIAVMYQPGGYGDVQGVSGTGVAVVVDLTGDNLGPRSVDDVIARWAALTERFPGASISAATLDDVADVVGSVQAELPVVTSEIGDTWIQGVGSDPVKTAGFRALCRLRRGWIDSGVVDIADPALRAASTALLCVAEHTWGLDQKTHWPDTTHWSAEELSSLGADPALRAFEASWYEQRSYLDRFVELLGEGGRTDLASESAAELAATRRVERVGPRGGAASVGSDGVGSSGGASGVAGVAAPARDESGATFTFADGAIEFGPDGAVTRLSLDGVELATIDSPLGELRFRTYDAADFERWYSTYNAGTVPDDEWWARWDNTKPGLDGSRAASRWWSTRLISVHGSDDGVTAVLAVDAPDGAPLAAPARIEQTVRLVGEGSAKVVEFDLRWFDRPAARWPGSVWWRFAPPVRDPERWVMHKLDEPVSPLDVVAGGGAHLHCADRLVHPDAGLELELVDTSLVAPGSPRMLEWPPVPVDLTSGWSVCLHDNVWGTNFPMWDEGDARFRVVLRPNGNGTLR